MSEDTLIRPLLPTDVAPRGWTVDVDGVVLPDVRSVTIASKFGTLRYGMSPGGYDGWSFAEPGGGGSVVVPFVEHENGLMIGVVWEDRHNLGGMVQNLPRGFAEPGEAHVEAAMRELIEETGYNAAACFLLPGGPANPNSTFFETPDSDLGIRFFGLKVAPSHVEQRAGKLMLRARMIANDPTSRASRVSERIGEAEFIPWQTATRLRDTFTLAGIARLLAWRESTLQDAARVE